MKQGQKKAAKAAAGCLVLLLLYGCASHAADFYGGEGDAADAEGNAAGEGFLWTGRGPQETADGSGNEAAAGNEPEGGNENEGGGAQEKDADALPETIAVYVCGAVKHPGVYELAAGSRVYEAVALAGGMTKEASARSVNQAGMLDDGQMVVILTEEEAGACAGESGSGEPPNDGRVNINTAGAEELKSLPGIGDAKAAAIIAYREKNGAFTAVSDIKNVSGIGENLFARLESLVKTD